MGRTKMKAFVVSALLGLAAALPAPDVAHHATISHGGAVVSTGHFAPHVGPAVAVAHHAPVVHAAHAVHAAPVVAHAVHAPVAHAVHAAPVVAHAVHAAPVIAHAAPVVKVAAPAYHPPAPAYKAETYADEISPYTFTYAVADDYSKANFNAEEQSDGASNVAGS